MPNNATQAPSELPVHLHDTSQAHTELLSTSAKPQMHLLCPRSTTISHNVTPCHTMLHCVTLCQTMAYHVTPCHTVSDDGTRCQKHDVTQASHCCMLRRATHAPLMRCVPQSSSGIGTPSMPGATTMICRHSMCYWRHSNRQVAHVPVAPSYDTGTPWASCRKMLDRPLMCCLPQNGTLTNAMPSGT